MKIEYFGMTDVGRKRDKNEDSLLVNGDLGVFVVADGMGGHQGGEIASRIAVKTVEDTISQVVRDPEATIATDMAFDRSHPGELLKYAIRVASGKIYDEACNTPHLKGMGTTVVSLYVKDGKGFVAHAGDSRAYLARDGEMKQITADHSLVAEQLRAGFITRDEIKNHKYKNIITRSVGFQGDVEVDLNQWETKKGDRFLLCSDGLSNLVDEAELKRVLCGSSPKNACKRLIEAANLKGGDDNITVVIVSIL